MPKKALLCLLLCLSLLAGPEARALGSRYPDKAHQPVDYADMLPVTPFEEDDLLDALKELENLCTRNSRDRGSKETRQRVSGLYYRVLSELDELITKASLASVQYDASGGAEEDAALYLELSSQQTRLFDRCYQAFAVMAASPYRDILDASAGEGTAESLLGYEGLTEEEAAHQEEEELLVQTYDQIMSKGVPALAEGRVWTWETLDSAGVDSRTYETVSAALEAEQAQAAGEIYRKLVQLRTETAQQAGFDDYAAYAYWALYSRDYEPDEVEALREAAKTYILPLQLRLLDEIDEKEIRSLEVRTRKTGEEILDAIQPFIEDFDPEMGEAFAYMRRHHLYDIEYSEEKLFTGYTMSLPAYGSAIIFECPYGDYRDYSDLVHEFGHFNETYHCTQHDLWADFNIDVGEIHSQALELMFTSRAGELFGERYGEVYAKAILYNILDSILDGCLYDEFQTAAYQNPDLSVEELNRLFKDLSEEYGYYYDSDVEEDPTWVENTHTFQSPLYFISYATSALSALDLWFLYMDSPKQAKEVYLDLTALSLSLPYREAVEKAGLRDIFEPETIPELAGELEAYLKGERPAGRNTGHTVLLLVMQCVAVIFILSCAVVMIRCTRFLNRHDGWKYASPSYRRRRKGDPEEPWNARQEKPPWEF